MKKFKKSWIGLIGIPVSLYGEVTHAETLTFVAALVAIIPLAGFIGHATEELAARMGQRVGGLLNATMGNVAELVIATLLIFGGELEIVKLSITGSIIGNMLLVLGAAFLMGGLKFQELHFSAKVAGMQAASLALAVVGIMMPAVFHGAAPSASFASEEIVSAGVAAVLIALYLASLVFSYVTHQELLTTHFEPHAAKWSKGKAITVLTLATVAVAIEAEFLVGSLEGATSALHIPKLFVGLILVPLVGNAAEHWSAVTLAMKNKADASIEIAVGSSLQIAMFIAPLLIFISLLSGHPMNFFFSSFEITAVGLSTAVVALICLDGRSNWLEGAQLLAAYLIMAISFYFL